MTLKKVNLGNLGNLYSSSLKLSRKKVKELISLGLEKIIELTKKEPIIIEYVLWRDTLIKEIIGGYNGCEYVRALYELGVRKFKVECSIDQYLNKITTYIPIKLKDIPLVSERELKRYEKEIAKSKIS